MFLVFFPDFDDGVAVAWQGHFVLLLNMSLCNKNKHIAVLGDSFVKHLGIWFYFLNDDPESRNAPPHGRSKPRLAGAVKTGCHDRGPVQNGKTNAINKEIY